MRPYASVQNLLFYGLSGPIIALNVWLLSLLFGYFQHPITLVSTAAIFAFLLNYLVKFLERARFSRTQAVIIVLVIALALLIVSVITLVPIVISQTIQLLHQIPDWLSASQANIDQLEDLARRRRLPLDFKQISNQINTYIQNLVQQIPEGAVGFAGTLFSSLINLILIFVLSFYMLLYGKGVWQGLVNLLPPKIRLPFAESLQLNFHYFFLSQILLALFMVVSLTPIYFLLGVPFAFLFAMIIGISQLIPVVGATLGIGLVTVLILLQNWWLAIQVAVVAILLQQVKDNLLTPKLLGDFIGLNPIWILVSILLGFEIAGLFGTLIAIPIAGTIKDTFDTLRNRNFQEEEKA